MAGAETAGSALHGSQERLKVSPFRMISWSGWLATSRARSSATSSHRRWPRWTSLTMTRGRIAGPPSVMRRRLASQRIESAGPRSHRMAVSPGLFRSPGDTVDPDRAPREPPTGDTLVIGLDVGSTTVKAVVVDPATKAILWSDYQRHETRQAEKTLELLVALGGQFAAVAREQIRIFITGSGSGPLREPTGARFVQEVNAVTMAVDHLHPDVRSVIELGGQDAKIIIYKENAQTGDKRAVASMNDKCASGTGATIDKCMIKAGMDPAQACKLAWDPSKIHHVAAKCGVFAETDIVNLVKSGIPASEILCSLADAIVSQNLSVLTRGNTLKAKVLLLGGPNTYLPFLQACWRQRIPETWESRGYAWPKDIPIEELIFVPKDSQYYAAYGAALYGLHEPAESGLYRGLDPLKEFIAHGRASKLGAKAGPPLVADPAEREAFCRDYAIPKFEHASFPPGSVVRAVIGLDGGSTSSKAVLLDEKGELLTKQ